MLKLENGEPLTGIFNTHLLRLPDGALGLVQTERQHTLCFHVSHDEGQSWSLPVNINPPGTAANTSHDVGLVLKDSRIIVPVYPHIAPIPLSPKPKRLKRYSEDYFGANVACHLGYSYAYYSDDVSTNWTRSAILRMARNCAFSQV